MPEPTDAPGQKDTFGRSAIASICIGTTRDPGSRGGMDKFEFGDVQNGTHYLSESLGAPPS